MLPLSRSRRAGALTDPERGRRPEPQLEGPSEDVEVIRDLGRGTHRVGHRRRRRVLRHPVPRRERAHLRHRDEEDADFFNDSLPCGATLEETSVEGKFITATFELKDRPGQGPCPGSGNLAQTSFVIEDGAIVEWRRVALPGEQDSGQTA